MRWLLGCLLLGLAFAGCGDGDNASDGEDAAEESPTSTTEAAPDKIDVTLISESIRGLDSEFVRDEDQVGSECGVGVSGSLTGFDEKGELTLTDRSGTVLGVADLPHGDLTALEIDGGLYLSQECTISVTVELFEPPRDLVTFEFKWPDAGVTIEERDTPNGGAVVFHHGP